MFEDDMESPNQHTEAELDAAYGAGYNACHDNKNIETNPYPLNSILWQQFNAGWQQYDADYNPEYYKPQYFNDL